MTVNRYRNHILVLPEDDANRQLAIGFGLGVNSRQIQVLPEAGRWLNVCSTFNSQHIKSMQKYPKRHLVLLLDFDEDPLRAAQVRSGVPDDLIPTALSVDLCSGAGGDGRDAFCVFHKVVPGVAAGVEDGVVALPDRHAELVAAQVFPHVLDRKSTRLNSSHW